MKNFIILAIGLCFGVVAFWLKWQESSAVGESERTVSYIIINPDIPGDGIAAGDTLKLSELSQVSLPASDLVLPKIAYAATKENRRFVTLRPVRSNIPKGRVLTSDMFVDTTVARLDEMISEGNRAITVSVNAQNSLNNQVAPGNRIDVLGVVERAGELATEVLLDDVRVISVGDIFSYERWVTRRNRSFSTITLEVSSAQAREFVRDRLKLVSPLSIVMRSQCDSESNHAGCG